MCVGGLWTRGGFSYLRQQGRIMGDKIPLHVKAIPVQTPRLGLGSKCVSMPLGTCYGPGGQKDGVSVACATLVGYGIHLLGSFTWRARSGGCENESPTPYNKVLSATPLPSSKSAETVIDHFPPPALWPQGSDGQRSKRAMPSSAFLQAPGPAPDHTMLMDSWAGLGPTDLWPCFVLRTTPSAFAEVPRFS